MLLTGRLAAEVAAEVERQLPALETRVVPDGAFSAEDLSWADAYSGFVVPSELAASGVAWVHLMAAGVDRAVPVLRAMPVPPLLTRTTGAMPEKIAAYVLAHVLGEFQNVAELRRQQSERVWLERVPTPHVSRTAVVLGTGRIGRRIGTALKAVGFRVVGVSRSGEAVPGFDAVTTPAGAEAEYRRCAVLVCTLPLTAATRHAVDARIFGLLSGAVFVNVGRGATVSEADLRDALGSGAVRRAVLDVFETEPLPEDSWLWTHERVTVTPHVAGLTSAEDVVRDLVPAYVGLREGRLPAEAVDLERGY
jgi:phosphoglycerate dehydrogenase-like enzyme